MPRVVRAGRARWSILEITTPQRPPLSWFYSVWFDRIVPLLGTVGRRERRLHLPAAVGAALPAGAELAELMNDAGLRDVRYLLLGGRDRRDPLRARLSSTISPR